MANIGFLLTITGIAAAGGAIDVGTSFVSAMAMTFAGAALMWLFREDDEDGEEKDDSPVPCGGGTVDKPAGEGAGGCGGVKTGMKEYTYRVVREYQDGSRGKRARTLTRFKQLKVGGLYVHLGKGFPGMQRVLSEETRQTGDQEEQGC